MIIDVRVQKLKMCSCHIQNTIL